MADNVSGRQKGKDIIIKATQQEKPKAQGSSSDTSVPVSSEGDKQRDKKPEGTRTKSSDASVYVSSEEDKQRDKKPKGTRTKSSDASVYVSSEKDKQRDKKPEGTRTKSSDASVYVSSEEDKQRDKKPERTRTKSSDASVYVSSEEDKHLDKKSEGKRTSSSDASVYVSSEEYILSDKKSVASGYKSPEEYHKCDPCKNVGDDAMAEWFCSGCKIYLCSMCFESHLSRNSSKNHAKVGKDGMSPRKSPTLCTPCKIVGAEVKPAGYCEDCCCYLCDECCKCHSRDEITKHHVIKMNKAANEGIRRDGTASVSKINIKDEMTGEENTNEEFTYVRDINVASHTDKKEECLIIDMALVSDNELVLCDAFNKCLKLVDISKDRIKDVLPLQSKPLAVTAMSNDRIAVVLKDCYLIQILDIRETLVIDRTIKTNGITAGVRMVNKHLYVSFWKPVKFQKLHPTGSIIKTIKPDDEVRKRCFFPHNFAVNTDETAIYVSDGELDKVLSIDMNGNLLNLYQGELECPYGIIIVPSGSVYVCNRHQDIVYKMRSDLSEAIVLLGPGDGVTGPQAMHLNANDQHLYISSGSFGNKRKNFLKVYKC